MVWARSPGAVGSGRGYGQADGGQLRHIISYIHVLELSPMVGVMCRMMVPVVGMVTAGRGQLCNIIFIYTVSELSPHQWAHWVGQPRLPDPITIRIYPPMIGIYRSAKGMGVGIGVLPLQPPCRDAKNFLNPKNYPYRDDPADRVVGLIR